MSKKVLVISTSLRKNSNSEAMADSFIVGAQAAGHDVRKSACAARKLLFVKGAWLVRAHKSALLMTTL